jgi:ring-1,2-phenylacetyl-CoA epoxidase subunit PaaA/ring-1,2-phenylacetyl-CoA epoxidase subunit PaaC
MDAGGSVALLAQPLPDWQTFIAVNLVLDGMFTAVVEAASDSTFVQLAHRARKILQEERSHQVHATAWTRRLASNPAHRDGLATAVQTAWAEASGWPGNGARYATLVAEGLLAGSTEQLQRDVRATVVAALDGTDLDLDLP